MLIAWLVLHGILRWKQAAAYKFNLREINDNTTNYSFEQAKSNDDLKCSSEWYSFGDKCYKVFGKEKLERLTWLDASEKCTKYGGQLATIHSKELQDFIMVFLLLNNNDRFWIGMHDRANESVYEWVDNSSTNFTNWASNEPSGLKDEKEDCVEMIFSYPGFETGEWNDLKCDSKNPYLCQKNKERLLDKMEDPKYCPETSGGGWSLHQSCYHVLSTTKTWKEAEEFCISSHQGHLVAVTDFAVKIFLDYLLRNHTADALWIGLKFEGGPLMWSSGWHVGLSSWEDDEHGEQDLVEGACVSWTTKGVWKIDSCERKLAFVCETSSAVPPVLKPPDIEGSRCPENPEGWKDLGGEYCYFINYEKYISWFEANFVCMRRGGALVSIHSQEEVDTLEQFFKYRVYFFHIGLYRELENPDEFAWTDGSAYDFVFFDEDEPNSRDELCTELRAQSMAWNDISCKDEKGYICSVKKIPPNVTGVEYYSSCQEGLSVSAVVGLIFCIVLVMSLIGVVIYHFRPNANESQKKHRKPSLINLQPQLPKPGQRYRSGEIVVMEDADYENLRT